MPPPRGAAARLADGQISAIRGRTGGVIPDHVVGQLQKPVLLRGGILRRPHVHHLGVTRPRMAAYPASLVPVIGPWNLCLPRRGCPLSHCRSLRLASLSSATQYQHSSVRLFWPALLFLVGARPAVIGCRPRSRQCSLRRKCRARAPEPGLSAAQDGAGASSQSAQQPASTTTRARAARGSKIRASRSQSRLAGPWSSVAVQLGPFGSRAALCFVCARE